MRDDAAFLVGMLVAASSSAFFAGVHEWALSLITLGCVGVIGWAWWYDRQGREWWR